jgi:hypothetical protein
LFEKKLAMKKIFFIWCGVFTLTLACSLRAASQVKEEFDNLVFYIPIGLTTSKTETNMVLTDATLGSGQYFTITVNKSVLSFKKMEKGFPVFWRETLKNDGVDNPPAEPQFVKAQNPNGWSCFRGGKMVSYNVQAPAFFYHLMVMRYLGVTLKIITKSNSEELFLQKYPLLLQLVSSVNFKTPPPKQNNPADSTGRKNW